MPDFFYGMLFIKSASSISFYCGLLVTSGKPNRFYLRPPLSSANTFNEFREALRRLVLGDGLTEEFLIKGLSYDYESSSTMEPLRPVTADLLGVRANYCYSWFR